METDCNLKKKMAIFFQVPPMYLAEMAKSLFYFTLARRNHFIFFSRSFKSNLMLDKQSHVKQHT